MRTQNYGVLAAVLMAGLGIMSCASAQQDYRLAFSKAENIEVFVEGASQDAWCTPTLKLRAVHGGAQDSAGLARLLPKLGALLKQQCPQAVTANWRSVDASGTQFAQGTSMAQDGWQLVAAAATTPPVTQAPVAVAVTPATEPATPAMTPPATASQNFAVGDWQPPNAEQQTELIKFLTTTQDQNGCKFMLVLNLEGQPAPARLLSEGDITCGADGYAQGSGTLYLERSDGAQLDRIQEKWFSHGLAFSQAVQGLDATSIVAVREEYRSHRIWLRMGSDGASQSHYLLQAHEQFGINNRLGFWGLEQISVLTNNTEAFRQAESIRDMIDSVLASAPGVLPTITNPDIRFADAAQGIFDNEDDHSLYRISAYRPRGYRRGEAQYGAWRYDLRNGKNELFTREARLAERERQEAERLAREKRQEEERLAYEQRQEAARKERERIEQLVQLARVEQNHLRQYQRLLEVEQKGGAQALREQIERDLSYELIAPSNRGYASLMRQRHDRVQRIVHVDVISDAAVFAAK